MNNTDKKLSQLFGSSVELFAITVELADRLKSLENRCDDLHHLWRRVQDVELTLLHLEERIEKLIIEPNKDKEDK